MIVHIDKLIRHLRSQIETAEQMRSEFVYLTKREAEGCLELAEAQDVIQEIMKEKDHLVRCKDCKHYRATPGYCAYDRIWQENKGHVWGMYCKPDWYCADGERMN